MNFKDGMINSTFQLIEDKLEKAIIETLKLDFDFVDPEVQLSFKEDQVVLVTFEVDNPKKLIDLINNGQFKEKLDKKLKEDEGIPKAVVLDSVFAGTN